MLGEEMARNMGGGDGQKYQRNVWLEMWVKGMVRVTEEMVGKGEEEMAKTMEKKTARILRRNGQHDKSEGQKYQSRRWLLFLDNEKDRNSGG